MHDELRLVIDALARLAPLVAEAPDGLNLPLFAEQFREVEAWVARVLERDNSSRWLEEVATLARESLTRCAGTAVVHLDLRDDKHPHRPRRPGVDLRLELAVARFTLARPRHASACGRRGWPGCRCDAREPYAESRRGAAKH